jgi:hypothetical protein
MVAWLSNSVAQAALRSTNDMTDQLQAQLETVHGTMTYAPIP